jgi:hypothetical protein
MKRINSLLVVAVVVFFSTLFVSCGNSRAISMVRTGYLDIDPERTIDEVFKDYPRRKGNVKWNVEEVIKQKEGNVYIISATFNHSTSNEALYSFDGDIVRNDYKNNFILDLLIHDPDEDDITRETSDERRIAVVDKYADMYDAFKYDKYGLPVNTDIDHYIQEQYFYIDDLKITIIFACAPQTEEIAAINIIHDFTISTDILGNKEVFNIRKQPLEYNINEFIVDTLYNCRPVIVVFDARNSFPPTRREWDDLRAERIDANKEEAYVQQAEQFNNEIAEAIKKIDARIEHLESFLVFDSGNPGILLRT